tara:strand:- start:50 stop:565 length:516 start_codon:yes stop_codon:yes gene_type:complete
MKYHYVYQTKNTVNDKTYIGIHSTYNLNDGYLGSGLSLLRAIKKHGKIKFKKQIMSFFDSREEAFKEEAYLVNESWCRGSDNYNLDLGGRGGSGFRGKKHSLEEVERIKKRMKGVTPVKAVEKRKKSVYCGYLEKEFSSLTACSVALNCSQALVSLMANNKRDNKYNIKLI